MNKKGFVEMADLAGFFLIFVTIIIFSFIFIYSAPKASFNLLDEEHGDYLARNGLIDFLDYGVEKPGEVADVIVFNVKDKKFDDIRDITTVLFAEVAYSFSINENDKIVFLNTNLEDAENKDPDEVLKKLENRYKSSSFVMPLKSFYGGNIWVRLDFYYGENL